MIFNENMILLHYSSETTLIAGYRELRIRTYTGLSRETFHKGPVVEGAQNGVQRDTNLDRNP